MYIKIINFNEPRFYFKKCFFEGKIPFKINNEQNYIVKCLFNFIY